MIVLTGKRNGVHNFTNYLNPVGDVNNECDV